MSEVVSIQEAVKRGLSQAPKTLPPFLFYDKEGSRLFEQITALSEYYLTRAERWIFEHRADEISREIERTVGQVGTLIELGAGTSAKTEVLLRSFAKVHKKARYVAADVSPSALEEGHQRLLTALPDLETSTFVGSHREALLAAAKWTVPKVALFIGSSIGNYDTADAIALLRCMAEGIGRGGGVLLGTDLKKSVDMLVAAYDDKSGITAAFNKNVLARVNRELAADFDLALFDHEARYNEAQSRIEMHLVSRKAQRITIGAMNFSVEFAAGESIHTESSHKYDDGIVDHLLESSGFTRQKTFMDDGARFAVHWATVRA